MPLYPGKHRQPGRNWRPQVNLNSFAPYDGVMVSQRWSPNDGVPMLMVSQDDSKMKMVAKLILHSQEADDAVLRPDALLHSVQQQAGDGGSQEERGAGLPCRWGCRALGGDP